MSRRVDRDLQSLRELALQMGALAEAILAKSLRALAERDAALAAEVDRDDLAIDRLDVEIDGVVLEVLALQAPVAVDLREVVVIKTLAGDLERVGDLSRNIARSAVRLSERESVEVPARLERLAAAAQRMLQRSLDAFTHRDPELARQVLGQDDEVDREEERAIQQAIDDARSHPERTPQEVELILVAKSLERVADHATNIAEEVVLLAEAKNLKHAPKLAG